MIGENSNIVQVIEGLKGQVHYYFLTNILILKMY